MATLDWSLGDIENYDELWILNDDGEGERLNYTTDSLIWATMGVGLNSITKKNIDKWLFRMGVLNKISDVTWNELCKRHVLERHIGLKTNVIDKTDAEFWKTVKDDLTNEVNSEIIKADNEKVGLYLVQ
jgi:hypothetical protein